MLVQITSVCTVLYIHECVYTHVNVVIHPVYNTSKFNIYLVVAYGVVHWPKEDCVSIVPGTRVSGDHQVGTDCSMTIRSREYTGQVAATGKCIQVLLHVGMLRNIDDLTPQTVVWFYKYTWL